MNERGKHSTSAEVHFRRPGDEAKERYRRIIRPLGASVFFRNHPYMGSTTVLPDSDNYTTALVHTSCCLEWLRSVIFTYTLEETCHHASLICKFHHQSVHYNIQRKIFHTSLLVGSTIIKNTHPTQSIVLTRSCAIYYICCLYTQYIR